MKERARSFLSVLPFTALPKLLKKQLILFVVQIVNFTIHPNSISPFLSPATIVTGRQPDVNIHCRVNFGEFCQVSDEPSPLNDTSKPRTLDDIALRLTGNSQAGYYF